MDIDVMGKHIHGLLAFKDKLEGMMGDPDGKAKQAGEAVDEILSLKRQLEGAMPDIEKLIADVSLVSDDIAKIKEDLAPALSWIAEQQKIAEAAKAQQLHDANQDAKTAETDRPLAHLAEVEAAPADDKPEGESEQPAG